MFLLQSSLPLSTRVVKDAPLLQDLGQLNLSCTYLAYHELEIVCIVINIIVVGQLREPLAFPLPCLSFSRQQLLKREVL